MAKGPYRDHKEEILESFHQTSKKVSPSFASAFGIRKRTQKVRILTGYKIIITHEGEKGEESVYVCAKRSGEIDYDDNSALSLAKIYVATHEVEKYELRPVVLVKKGDDLFEVISSPVKVLFSEDIERIEWEKRLSGLGTEKLKEIMEKVIIPKRNLFQRFIGQMFNL